MLVVSGDGPGCPGRRIPLKATVGQPTNTADPGPQSKESRTAPRCYTEKAADRSTSLTAIEMKPGLGVTAVCAIGLASSRVGIANDILRCRPPSLASRFVPPILP